MDRSSYSAVKFIERNKEGFQKQEKLLSLESVVSNRYTTENTFIDSGKGLFINNCQPLIEKHLICNPVSPSYCKENISIDKSSKHAISKWPILKHTWSESNLKKTRKDKFDQDSISDITIEDNEYVDHKKKLWGEHKRKNGLTLDSSEKNVPISCNKSNPITNDYCGSIKVALSPQLDRRQKPLKAIHGICHQKHIGEVSRHENCADNNNLLNNIVHDGGQNKNDILETVKLKFTDGQLKDTTGDTSSITQGIIDPLTRQQVRRLDTSLEAQFDDKNVKLNHTSHSNTYVKEQEAGHITSFTEQEGKIKQDQEKSGFNTFLKFAFCKKDLNIRNKKLSSKESEVNSNTIFKWHERKPLNVNKTTLHSRLKALFSGNTPEKVQGDLNISVISSASSTSQKENKNDSEGYNTNQVNACLLDHSQFSGQFINSSTCNEKSLCTKLSHTESKAGDNSEKFQTKENSLSDETNIALGCVNKGLFNGTAYTQLQINEDRCHTDFGKKHVNVNLENTGEASCFSNSVKTLETKLADLCNGKVERSVHCQKTGIGENLEDSNILCKINEVSIHIEDTNGSGQYTSELDSTSVNVKEIATVSKSDNKSTYKDDNIKDKSDLLSRSIETGNSSCDNFLTFLEPNQKDNVPNNEEFIARQKKKIALYRGKFSVNADHHSAVSSNLSLASSKGSSKKLNVGDIDQMLKMDRPKSRLGALRYSRENVLRNSPMKCLSSDMHGSHVTTHSNVKLETSYTSQDSGYVPGLSHGKGVLCSSHQMSELSSQFSEHSSAQSKSQGDVHQPNSLTYQRYCGSGQSDNSYKADMDKPVIDQVASRQKRSKSYTDISKKSKGKRHTKYKERSHSQHDMCESVDTLSQDRTIDSSLDNSAHSSLCLMGPTNVQSSNEHASSPMLAFCDKQNFRHSSYVVESDFMLPSKDSRSGNRSKSTKRKNKREWGTVGNIPRTVIWDKHHDKFLRTVSFDNGISDMQRARRSYEMIDKIESESEDSDSSIDIENFDDFSMADDASHVGGCSLDDKLRLAASKGQVERIPTLLAQGSGFQPDKEGRTAIHYAALSGYSEAVRILAANGCDVNTQDNLGYSALHRAAAQGHLEVVRVLCDCGCNLNIQDDVHGNSALHEAAWNGYSRTVELLSQYKASVILVNKAGFSALHLAAQNGHNQSARCLLYAGCDPSHKNNYGDTPLHTAGRYGHAGVTRILLSAKCRISEQNKNGDSALHISAALKRRKIAKLLVEANINISLKNKQNETAADVSRRKDHPEILLIITSQPKLCKQKKKEDKKKKKEGKVSGIEESDDPRKDKKMFFFRKRSKSKDKENKENRDASTDRLDSRPFTVPSSVEVQAGLGSDAHSHSSGGDGSKGLKGRTNSKEKIAKSQGTTTARPTSADRHHKKVHGLLTQYEAKTGVQYYRDLAGNIKQGPIGFAPVCNCGPHIKKIEQRMEADKNNLYDHIDATHKMLSHKMEDMDHKCNQRVHSADRMYQHQMLEHQQVQDRRVNTRILQERQETDKMIRFQEHLMRSEYMDYVGRKVGALEDHYAPLPSRCKGCDHCGPSNPHYRHHRDDHDLNPSSMPYSVYQQGTGLYRSKSDETLSISSSHPSKRHWKMRSKPRAIREIKDKYLRTDGMQGEMMDGDLKGSRPAPQGQGGGGSSGVVGNIRQGAYQYEDIYSKNKLPSGRSPEGQSSNNEYSEQSSYLDPVSHYGTWNMKRNPINTDLMQQLGDNNTMQQDFEKLTVRDFPQSSLSNGQTTSTPVSQPPRPQSGPQLSHSHQPIINSAQTSPEVNTNYSAPYNTPAYNSPNYNTPNSSYNTHNNSSKLTSGSSYVLSPEQVQVHHTKTDSGSNPDSGYSSKIYGIRPTVSGRSIGTNHESTNSNTNNAQHHEQVQPAAMSQYQPPNIRVAMPPQQQQIPQHQRYEVSPTKALHKNRGYSSDGCPGMRRPKQDAYASDNCAGMRMKKSTGNYRPALNDWYEKQVSGKGNGVISEMPAVQHGSQQHLNGSYPPSKPRDFWPGKATQV